MNIFLKFARNLRLNLAEKQRQAWQNQITQKLQQCGKGIHLSKGTAFVCPEKISLGNNVHIGINGWLQGCGGIVIADNVHISRNCAIFSASHNFNGKRLPYDEEYIVKPVRIEKNVWLGMNVMIVPGVTIGEGAIVGLGTVVVKDVPPLAIVGGHGHRILKYRDEDHYQSLENQEAYGGRGGRPLNE